MLRVITLNLNGIRSAARKGFFSWLEQQNADVVCVQETKAQMGVLTDEVLRPQGYFNYFSDAEKSGYSGVGIYCRRQPDKVIKDIGWSVATKEGRYIETDFGKLSVVSLYLPSGTMGPHRQTVKYEFMEHYFQLLKELHTRNQDFIICGDWNIAHKNIDLRNWRGNQKNSGFLPDERAWLGKVFDELNWVDAFRIINQEQDQYTWWSNRGRAYEKNVGWRIDYHIVSSGLKDKIKAVQIYKEQRFSDHAPLIIDYDYTLNI